MNYDKLRSTIDTIDFVKSELESASFDLEELAKNETIVEFGDALRYIEAGMKKITKAYWLLENQNTLLRIKEMRGEL